LTAQNRGGPGAQAVVVVNHQHLSADRDGAGRKQRDIVQRRFGQAHRHEIAGAKAARIGQFHENLAPALAGGHRGRGAHQATGRCYFIPCHFQCDPRVSIAQTPVIVDQAQVLRGRHAHGHFQGLWVDNSGKLFAGVHKPPFNQ